ncbi:MAG: hypothetical protein IT581_20350 [Verrucomicrobiales bacterium]|nr:hypothetical protein [Verrucomicrobiales bacterium]
MSQEPLQTPEFHLEELASLLESVVTALAEAGVGGTRLRELLATKVHARCVACGSQASGEEILEALAIENPAASAKSALRRSLTQHHCLREECDSRHYQLNFSPAPDLVWNPVLERAQQLKAARHTVTKGELEDAAEDRRISRRQTVLGSLLILVGLGSLWGARRWWASGFFPGTRRPNKYQVDPQSLPSASGDH